MNKSQQVITLVVILAVLGLAIFGLVHLFGGTNGRGGVSNGDSITVDNNLHAGVQIAVGTGVSDAQLGFITQPSIGSCAGLATSTQFAVANPFGATSTAFVRVIATAASSTVLEVGTSTRSTGQTLTSVSPTLINATIPTSTTAQLVSGVLVGSAGYLTPGAATFAKIVVGPNDFVGAFASSTYITGFTQGIASCTYKIVWESF